MQVSLDELDDGYGYESFESGLGATPTSTSRVPVLLLLVLPFIVYVNHSLSCLLFLPCRVLSHNPPPPQSANIISMEQQALLHQIINEQEEMSKSIKKNNERIAVLEVHLNNQSESSSSNSSSGEKRRLITKDLTVSSVSTFVL